MNWKDATPEQRAAWNARAAATRKAKRDAALVMAVDKSSPLDPLKSQAAITESEESAPVGDGGDGLRDFEREMLAEGILTVEDIYEARAAAAAKVQLERKQAAKKRLAERLQETERRQAGMIPVDQERQAWLQESVDVMIRMPRLRRPNGHELPPEPILLDQQHFVHGRTVSVSRAQALTLLDIMGKAWMHAAHVDGRSRSYYNEHTGQMVYQGGTMQGALGGPSFEGIHRRAN